MLDTVMRPLIDRPLDAAGRGLARRGLRADTVTMVGLVTGLLASGAIAIHWFATGLVLIVINRLFDGLDGAVARATETTDRGGYLDIVADYVFYASVPLGFAIADPAQNALPAAALLAAFCLTCSSFLAYAIVAAKRGLETAAHGRKSFFYSTGLVEGTETIAFFLAMTLLPEWFAQIAWLFTALCVLTALQRSLLAMNSFRSYADNGDST